ncbi:MAG: hypothetical protein KDA92_20520, partial [Planctomycetales bacterium]|nr:hypothetical protein [Planctomycetales bacterium]
TDDTLTDILNYFDAQFGADVSVSGNTLVLRDANNATFTFSKSVTAPPTGGDLSVDNGHSTVSHWQNGNVVLSGTPKEGEVWQLTLTAWNGSATTGSYTVPDNTKTAADVANEIVRDLTGTLGTTGQIPLSGTPTHVAVQVAPAALQATAEISGTVSDAWQAQIVLQDDDATYEVGDVWYLQLAGKAEVSYAVQNGDTLQQIAQGLGTALGAGYAISTASSTGGTVDTLLVQADDGQAVSVTSIRQVRKAGDIQGAADPNGGNHMTGAVTLPLELAQDQGFPFGETWTIRLNGRSFRYTVPTQNNIAYQDRNLAYIVSQLAEIIDSATEDGQDLYQVVHSNSSITVSFASNPSAGPYDTIAADIARGDGSVRAVIDIDHANSIQGAEKTYVPRREQFTYTFFGTTYTYYYWTYDLQTFNYTQTPYVELWFEPVGTSGFQFVADSMNSDLIDEGSLTLNDAFLERELRDAGKYRVRVGSFRDYADNSFLVDAKMGVASGISYQVNVSVDRHATNTDAIELYGKTVTFTSGNALAQKGTITDYDPQSKTFTVENITSLNPFVSEPLAITPAIGDQFDITFNLAEEGYAYEPVDDSYTIELTKQPADGEVVTVDVLPQVTRTYNADAAFDANANYGENAAIQVAVATPQAKIELTGTPTNGETWSVFLDNQEFDVPAGIDLPATATALVNRIEGQVVAGRTYHATSLDATTLLVTAEVNGVPQNFYADFQITPETDGVIEQTGTAGQTGGTWATAQFEMAGIPAPAEHWTLTLDGTPFDYLVQFRDDWADIASELAELVNANPAYVATVIGRVITINRQDQGDFTATAAITPDSQGDATVTPQVVFVGNNHPTLSANWNLPQTVGVRAIDDPFIDGSDAIVFPGMDERVNEIRGPLTVDGGIQVGEEQFLESPFMLPGEMNFQMPDGDITTVVAVDIGGTNYLGFQHAGVTHVDATTGEQPGFDPRIDPRVSGAIYEFLIVDGTERGRVFEVLQLSDVSSEVVVLDYLYDDFLTEIGGVGNLAAAAQTY